LSFSKEIGRRKLRSFEMACIFPRWGLKKSSSPWCGLIKVIPSPVVKFERGNYVIMALEWFSFTGNYNEF
jgi:hypothetical protein